MAPPHDAGPLRGVFDTLLVRGGAPVATEEHVERLSASVRALYGVEPPADLGSQTTLAAAGTPLGRLRLTVRPRAPWREGEHPGDGGVELQMTVDPVDPEIVFPEVGVALRSFALPGGLGPHKLVDRPPIERSPNGSGALLLDGDEVLEAGWASLFAVRDGVLRTPPLDGRILPGTTRRAVLEIVAEAGLAAAEEPLSREDLLAAEEVFLTGSVRGIEGAVELDGQPLAGLGELSRRVAAALRRRWLPPGPRAADPVPAGVPRPGRSAR